MSLLEKFPRYEFCCFVFDLRLGSLCIGAFLAINAALSLISNLASGVSSFLIYLALIVELILGIYLALGAYKEKAKWVEYYLWGKLVYLAIEVILIIIFFFSSVPNAIYKLIIWALEIYFWMCVNSYYMKLEGILPATTSISVTRTVTTA